MAIYDPPGRAAELDAFHAPLVPCGGLAFDIGAHVGERSASFLRRGARVVAVEPQPDFAALLRRTLPTAMVVEALAGATPGRATLRLNGANPTVATASAAFVAASRGAPGWQGQTWDGALEREVITLDALVAVHGLPDFVKIDVEGWEAEVLRGLSAAPAALSFEFTTHQRAAARDCLALLHRRGYRRFNACLGETLRFVHRAPLGAAEMALWLTTLPARVGSGDVYAFRPASRSRRAGRHSPGP